MKAVNYQQLDRIVTPTEFAYRLGVTTTVLYTLEKQGKIPSRVRISRRRTGWKESEISRFIANLK